MWRIKTDRPPDVPASRTARLAVRLVIALAIVIAALFAAAWLIISDKVDQLDRSQHGARQLYSQAVTAGASPVTTPPGAPPASKVEAAAGPRGPGPTADQISAAVEQYCAQHEGCTGTPSQAQVAEAVRAFCSAGACRGRTGATGASGASGQPGEAGASGAPGPGPTDTQVSAAVTAYCAAHGDCTGPAGPKGDTGDQGADGSPGRGIASVDCTGLGIDQLTIHFDDGATQTVPCDQPTPSGGPTS